MSSGGNTNVANQFSRILDFIVIVLMTVLLLMGTGETLL